MKTFDFNRMALDKFPIEFLAEVGIRCLFTFVLVFLFLKLSGRRGVRQMSLFEVVIILTLGSAAGDVTFYEDVPMLPVVMVFISIMIMYRLSTLLMSRSEKIQQWMEGKPLIIVNDGVFAWESMQQENITHDEFFMELRQQGVEHLGQVRLAILEVNGAISVFFFTNEQVKPGLPVLPKCCVKSFNTIEKSGEYACSQCSLIITLSAGSHATCQQCGHHHWVEALHHQRAK
ncbi:DUF421 domain-containing protein [Yersinia vastinensis]|uniref:DUF421 domain-containing protein n=1 Tax=Yersinia vastinensis TaxID=2890318 RepID=UPI0005E72608|nr:DUF421 domain-containing protein [Yersinia vastinensis]OVZ98025.1 DUF421 domain-containing protein [Yersinia frederiksenii]CNI12027.1 putative inner membrane protein [Yersinia frederiksenii]